MAVHVRRLRAADVPRLLDLIDGLADYESLPRPDSEARERMTHDATARQPRFRTLLSEIDNSDGTAGRMIVGYAIYFFTYSTFLARPTLYLEDIFVMPDARGQGAGRALFNACAREAVRQECGRMEWQVLDWNAPSIAFYERAGARMLKEWQLCRLADAALLAAGHA